MPGNIGWQGLVVILIILLVIFGPKRLPEMGRSIGRGMREFKDSISGVRIDDDEDEARRLERETGRAGLYVDVNLSEDGRARIEGVEPVR